MFDVLIKLKFFFKEHKWQYIISFITLAISNIFAVFIPFLIGRFIDAIVTGEMDANLLFVYTIQFASLVFITYGLDLIWGYGLFSGAYKLQRQMRSRLMRHFLRMRAPYFEKFRTGDLLARGTQDIRALADTAGYGMLVLMSATGFTATLVVMMGVTVSWPLTFATVLPLLPMAYVIKVKGAQVDEAYEISQKSFSSVNDDVLEMIDGMRVIRAYVKEGDFIDKFKNQTSDLLKKNNRVSELSAVFAPTVKTFAGISTMIALTYGAILVSQGGLTVGDIIAFQMYLGMMIWPIISVSELILILRQGSASMRRVEAVISATDGLDFSGKVPARTVEDFQFNDFTFKYTSSETINLNHIELALPKGKTLGIVGKTGSGKTTLIRQLLNQFPKGQGTFTMGQQAYSEYEDPSLRQLIGYVPQDHVLFSRSVRDNIAFGKEDASDQDILKSIRLSSFEEDLNNMEHGLDTMIGEKGVAISGGQKQRISIARALIKDPQILILDDSLSAVDAKTEQSIIANIEAVRKDKTTIISTHRLSAVKGADEIVVLDQGRIIERGTHDELIEKQGWYYDQFKKQEIKEFLNEDETEKQLRSDETTKRGEVR
ncbi:ABC transporter ATP-binding protein [Alkalibacterium kapii]|uniref:Multidrug ABC transporter permease/ATP-binding protein n=1 Tax=Alkalibacterium kapii TaxID=426704 RepID=A0A511AV82_9LACT|nr:ABC transporter ATP-binding protein [Alkalibacterium kapii]GEK92109.1 multidrug ABC transporter permease/ATP-binding protein [Alkalibacterium kapii]